MTEDSIHSVGVGKSTDLTMLAFYAKNTEHQSYCISLMEAYLRHITTSSFQRWRDRQDSDIGTLHVVTDSDKISYFALVKAGYPDFLVNSLLDEVKVAYKQHTAVENQADSVVLDDLCKLVDKYSRKLGSDRIQPLEITMYRNQENQAGQILEVLRKTSAESTQVGSRDSQLTARVFYSGARKLERVLYWRKVKLIIIVIAYVFAIFLYVIIPLSMEYEE